MTQTKRSKPGRGKVIFIERYPAGMKRKLHARAKRNGRSMSGEAVQIIEAALAAEAVATK